MDDAVAGVGKAHIIDGRVRQVVLLKIFFDQGLGAEFTAASRTG